jgi:SAM-dependent methyltransferase
MDASEYDALYHAESAHFFLVALREAVLGQCGAELRRDGARVLDAGCGTGGLLADFARICESYGVDCSEHALGYCRRRGHHGLTRASITALPFAADSFDVLSSLDVIYHRSVADDGLALREFHRVLKQGGSLIIHVPAFECLRNRHDDSVHTQRRYTRAELRHKLVSAGFHIECLSYRNLFLLPLIYARKILARRTNSQSDVFVPPRWINRVFLAMSRLEQRLIIHIGLPFGSSLWCVARKVS